MSSLSPRDAPSDERHTPGPWPVVGRTGGTIRSSDGGWIANVNWRNRKANARLIAAAPDLLGALKALNLAFFGIPFKAKPEELPALVAASEMARAAIAKAEGR